MTYRPIDRSLPKPEIVDAGPAPMLQWIAIDRLVVDDDYQRGLAAHNWARIREIAATFSWARFTAVAVAPIEGGRFTIIDGQHRTHAAAACGIDEVPCQVTQMDKATQAAAFTAINGNAIKIRTHQIYRAALVAGEPWAQELHDIGIAAGCTFATANLQLARREIGVVYQIAAVRKAIREYGRDRVAGALAMVRHQPGFADDAEYWVHSILTPTIKAIASRPHVLTAPPKWVQSFFQNFDIWALAEAADQDIRNIRRRGNVPPQKIEMLEARIGDALDKAANLLPADAAE